MKTLSRLFFNFFTIKLTTFDKLTEKTNAAAEAVIEEALKQREDATSALRAKLQNREEFLETEKYRLSEELSTVDAELARIGQRLNPILDDGNAVVVEVAEE